MTVIAQYSAYNQYKTPVLTMRDGVDLSRLPDRLIRLQAALGVNQVRREDGVNQRRLSKTSLTYRHI